MRHLFKNSQDWYIFDNEKMNLFKVNGELKQELESTSKEDLYKWEREWNKSMSNSFKEKDYNKKACGRLILNISDACNLGCKYCYAEEGSYGIESSQTRMSIDILKESILKVLDLFPEGILMIQFFGGEPLVNKEVLQEGILWLEDLCKKRNFVKPILTMVTNGTLIGEKEIDFFNEHFDSITISLDGEKDINDRQRIFKNSQDSVYDKVSEVIHKMKAKNRKFFLALEGTINDFHIDKFQELGFNSTYKDLSQLPVDQIHISPVIDSVEEDTELRCNGYSEFFQDWVENEFRHNKTNIRLKNIVHIMKAAKEKTFYGNGCGASQTDLAISVAGDLYPCFMFIGVEDFKAGHISEDSSVLREKLETIRHNLAQSEDNPTCSECWVKPLCAKTHGHCIGARYFTSQNIHEPVDRFCQISKSVLETSLALAEKEWSKS